MTAPRTLVAAAIQMRAALGDVPANLAKAERLVDQAFQAGARLVVLPEFFPSGVGFDPAMAGAALPLKGPALELLLAKASEHGGLVGGSFIAIREDGERRNTFVLAAPDGTYATHDKDLPTMWENCYYSGGDDPGILDTPLGPTGAALCWELVRSQTARRLAGRVDLVVGGSCWWTVPRGVPFLGSVARRNLRIMKETPSRMARMLGVPVVHAAHAGDFSARFPWFPGVPYRSHFLGEAQIVDARGNILARMAREEGDGVVTAEIEPGRLVPLDPIPESFWIPRFHPLILAFWHYQRWHGRRHYRRARQSQT